MTRTTFRYDVFISYSSEDLAQAEHFKAQAVSMGLTVFLASQDLKDAVGRPFAGPLGEALSESRSLVVLWTPNALKSQWVQEEIATFAGFGDFATRTIGLVPTGWEGAPKFTEPLGSIQRLAIEDAVPWLVKKKMELLRTEANELKSQLKESEEILGHQLGRFLYRKFWKPFFDNEVYVFTCGRHVARHEEGERGRGPRTNIDLQDYQTVCDIHSFFARQNPQTSLHIATPREKVADPDLNLGIALTKTLRNKDCIIVGSPDVSDYAELVLASIHGMSPWERSARKASGFVFLKNLRQDGGPATGQIVQGTDGVEGVERRVLDKTRDPYLTGRTVQQNGKVEPLDEDDAGEADRYVTYGVLAVAPNPCSDQGVPSTTMVLSGFTGVATNGVARFLTDEAYAEELFRLDKKLDERRTQLDDPEDLAFEALLRVEYRWADRTAARDSREILHVALEDWAYI